FPEKAIVEPKLGGKFEMLMSLKAPEGQRGSEGCKILSYLPNEMLAFEWNFPPKIPTLRNFNAHTQVVLLFERLAENKQRVRLSELGWQRGRDWDEGYGYFDKAWSRFLENFAKNKPAGAATSNRQPEKTWTDGDVKVTTWPFPDRRHDFEQVF